MSRQVSLPSFLLPGATELTLRRFNPWWSGGRGIVLPPKRRHLVGQIQLRMRQNLAPIVVVRGARQIGKSVAQQQVLEDLLNEGVSPERILRVQFDELAGLERLEDPILRIIDWYEKNVLGMSLNDAARSGRPATLFFDEVQNLDNWAPQLKSLVDSSTTQVIVTGSSALRIERGRDSLAGRITSIEAGTLSLTEVGILRDLPLGAPALADNGLEPLTQIDFWRELAARGRKVAVVRDEVFRLFSERGGYPIAHTSSARATWEAIADQLNENVIKRVIQHDLRLGQRGRKRDATLLEELFRAVCRNAGQTVTFTTLALDIHRQVQGNVGPQRIATYLKFLSDSLLVRAVEPLEIRLKKKRSGPKLCLADHALRASWLQEVVPLEPALLEEQPQALNTVAGHIAESVVGATLCTINGLDVSHKPEHRNEPEIDFVLSIGTRRIPIEVKYQRRIDPVRDPHGLRAFIGKEPNNAEFGVLVTRSEVAAELDPRIVAIPLPSLMLLR